MKKLVIDRRTFLRGAGGVAIALPFLEIMGCASRGVADGAGGAPLPRGAATLDGFPKRFIVFFTANGTENTFNSWRPVGGETDFQLSPILEPLAPYRDKLLILDGLSNEASYHGPGDAHQRGTGAFLTGTELQEGNFPGNDGAAAGYANGISMDQELANHIGKDNKLRSLELSVQNFGSSPYARISYLGAGQPAPPEGDPRLVFERAFSDLNVDPAEAAAAAARRRTILDAVKEDFTGLNRILGSADRKKLDEHLTAIREIEARLDASAVVGGSCQQPTVASIGDLRDPNAFPEIGRAQMDLLVMALACDITRVGSVMWSRGNNYMTFPWLGILEAHHDLSHHSDDDTVANEKLTAINRFFAEQLAYLAGKLASVPEGSGTLLDHTMIFWGNEQGKGNNHYRRDMPFVMLGTAGGSFRTGRYLQYDGDIPHNNLLVTMLNAYGVDTTTFGNPAYCTGPLAGLT